MIALGTWDQLIISIVRPVSLWVHIILNCYLKTILYLDQFILNYNIQYENIKIGGKKFIVAGGADLCGWESCLGPT